MRILFEPDPPAAGGGAGDTKPPGETPPTSADDASKGKTPREIALEKKISVLEDNNKTLGDQVKELLTAAETKGKPAPTTPPQSIGEEVNEFLGWGLA